MGAEIKLPCHGACDIQNPTWRRKVTTSSFEPGSLRWKYSIGHKKLGQELWWGENVNPELGIRKLFSIEYTLGNARNEEGHDSVQEAKGSFTHPATFY